MLSTYTNTPHHPEQGHPPFSVQTLRSIPITLASDSPIVLFGFQIHRFRPWGWVWPLHWPWGWVWPLISVSASPVVSGLGAGRPGGAKPGGGAVAATGDGTKLRWAKGVVMFQGVAWWWWWQWWWKWWWRWRRWRWSWRSRRCAKTWGLRRGEGGRTDKSGRRVLQIGWTEGVTNRMDRGQAWPGSALDQSPRHRPCTAAAHPGGEMNRVFLW